MRNRIVHVQDIELLSHSHFVLLHSEGKRVGKVLEERIGSAQVYLMEIDVLRESREAKR
jgi:hypothetical protein